MRGELSSGAERAPPPHAPRQTNFSPIGESGGLRPPCRVETFAEFKMFKLGNRAVETAINCTATTASTMVGICSLQSNWYPRVA